MEKYDNPIYDECRRWIQKRYEKKFTWDQLRLACKSNEAELIAFLKNRVIEDDWPEFTVEECNELVTELEDYEKRQKSLIFRGSDGALFDVTQDNGLKVPENERSCWQLYKNGLGWKEESVRNLEEATLVFFADSILIQGVLALSRAWLLGMCNLVKPPIWKR